MIFKYSYNIILLYINGDSNAAIFYDFKNIGIIDEINQTRRCIYNNFLETIPVEIILITLSNIDDVILKIIDNDIENVIENVDDSRANILHMVGFKKVVKDDVDKLTN